jgi:hypothetical protein
MSKVALSMGDTREDYRADGRTDTMVAVMMGTLGDTVLGKQMVRIILSRVVPIVIKNN